MSSAASRRQERRTAIVLLYQADVLDATHAELIERFETDGDAPLPSYARELIDGVVRDRAAIDELVDRNARGWDLDRLAAVERSALRVAVYELRAGTVPPAVAISEAVTYVKRYASPEAGSFVNGILGGIARELGVGR